MTTEGEMLLGVVLGDATISALRLFVDERIDARVSERVASIMAQADTASRYASIPDAARYFGLTTSAMRKRVDRGQVPSVLMEGRRLVDMSQAVRTLK